jgi:urease accessory protein
MSDPSRLLAALQLADSALPIGRFVHSHGVEAWLRDRGDVPADTLAELVEATVCEGVAPLDGAVLGHAHGACSISELVALDELLTARKLTVSSRKASQACGRQLAALAPQLMHEDPLVVELARMVRAGDTDGNLAVVEGTLARAFGLSAREAILVELRSAATALLSAAIRLGAVSPVRVQLVLAQLAPALARAASDALALGPGQLSATAPELELFALAHARVAGRLFAT